MKIDVRADISPAIARLASLKKSLSDRVIPRALNATADRAKTQARQEITATYALPSAEVGAMIFVSRASIRGGTLQATVEARGNRRGRSLNLIRFVEKKVTLAEGRRRARDGSLDRIRVKIRKDGGLRLLSRPHWAAGLPFIMTNPRGGTFVGARTGGTTKTGRAEIRGVYTIDVPNMFNTKAINRKLVLAIQSNFGVEFERALRKAEAGF